MTKEIIIIRDGARVPYSRSILSQSLTKLGLEPSIAYHIAQQIKDELIREGVTELTVEELGRRVYEKLLKVSFRTASQYKWWDSKRRQQEPIIILIGGASGVGSSTTAFQVAQRLGIRNVIGTDMLREVMRKVLSKELLPTLYESSFLAWRAMRTSVFRSDKEKIISGFEDQMRFVSVVIEAVMERAIREGISIIIEGIHVVPGFIKKEYLEKPYVFIFTLKMGDPERHKERFILRAQETYLKRPAEYYLEHFEEIRVIHDYIVSQAEKNGVEVIESYNLDEVVERITNRIIERLLSELY
jgi:2-phosphoglycerate kinase